MKIADIIVRFCTSLHSKFQIRDWLKLTSAERRLVRLLADVTFSQSRIWNLEWSEGRKCTIIAEFLVAVRSQYIERAEEYSSMKFV